jgi:23S rRNA-/tRNA-specific pseudouridylate synthase
MDVPPDPPRSPRAGREVLPAHTQRFDCVSHRSAQVPIVYQDEWLCVVNKPPDVHISGDGHPDTALRRVALQLDLARTRPDAELTLCHQLDYATSGLLCMAFKPAFAAPVCEAFAGKRLRPVCLNPAWM